MSATAPRVLFLCHGDAASPAAERARGLAAAWGDEARSHVALRAARMLRTTGSFWREIRVWDPDVVWVVDVSPPGVMAALAERARWGPRVVIDTGDAIHALARSMALRGRLGLALTWVLEETALCGADRVVTRGSFHAELLRARGIRATIVQDGVDPELFRPFEAGALRKTLLPGARLIVGLVGTLAWNQRLGCCYGWELLHALALLGDLPVSGLIVGEGSGLSRLRQLALDLGVAGRVEFVGRVPLRELPPLINAMDVALSTQTNDLVGSVRTTGKLPLYLACGRFVLATRVGEAARVLDEAQLLDFTGEADATYPARLAARLRHVLDRPGLLEAARAGNPALARGTFGYPVLASRALALIRELTRGRQ